MKRTIVAMALSLTLFSGAERVTAAVISPLANYGEMSAFISNDFEASINFADVMFDAEAFRITSADASGNVTTSGIWGLGEFPETTPLTALLGSDYYEVGLSFGNDDFASIFDVVLEVFDGLNMSLGSVTVQSNGNDFVDQFIGLRSDMPFRRVDVTYNQPLNQQLLAVYIDDFAVSAVPPAAIPEPTSLALLGMTAAGFCGVRLRRRRQDTSMGAREA